MNFDYDSEQNDLREAVRGLLARAYADSEQRRTVVKADPGFDEKTWSRLAEMGLLGLPFAEEDGGMGAGPVEVAIVAEEIGRVLAPEPFIETVVLAGGLVAAVGTRRAEGPRSSGASPRGRRSPSSRTPSPAPAGPRPPRASPPRRAATAGR